MVEKDNGQTPIEEIKDTTSESFKKGKKVLNKIPKKYKNIVIIIGALLILWYIGIFAYDKFTYYKIPQVYKDVVKTYEATPSSMKYVNFSKIDGAKIKKTFLYKNEEIASFKIDSEEPRRLTDFINYNETGYRVTNVKDSTRFQEKTIEKEGRYLKRGIQYKGEAKGNTTIEQFGYYEGDYSPYENETFKKLNAMTSDNTIMASYTDGITSIKEYQNGNGNMNVIPEKLKAGDIKGVYVIVNKNGKQGSLKIVLETYTPLKSDLYMNLILNNIKAKVRENRPLEIVNSKIYIKEKEAVIKIQFKGIQAVIQKLK